MHAMKGCQSNDVETGMYLNTPEMHGHFIITHSSTMPTQHDKSFDSQDWFRIPLVHSHQGKFCLEFRSCDN